MNAFVYFEYRGTFPPTIYAAIREPYRYIVEVAKREPDRHYAFTQSDLGEYLSAYRQQPKRIR